MKTSTLTLPILLFLFAGLNSATATPREVAGLIGLGRGGAGEIYALSGAAGGLYRSLDGAAWVQPALNYPDAYFTAISAGAGAVYAASSAGLLRSQDSGQTWQLSNSPETIFFVLPLADGSLLARTWKNGLLRSENRGNSWYAVGAEFATHPVFSLIQDQDGTVWAATFGNGVFQSLDNGVTWQAHGLYQRNVIHLAIQEKNLYASIYQDGVYHYNRDNHSWAPINSGLPENATISVFTGTPNGLAAGINSEGIYLKRSNSDWYLAEPAPSTFSEISGLLTLANGDWLVSTRPNGLFQINHTAHVWIPQSLYARVQSVIVNQCDGAQIVLENGAWLRSTGQKNPPVCGLDSDWQYCGHFTDASNRFLFTPKGDLLAGGLTGMTLYSLPEKEHCAAHQKKIVHLPRANLDITCLVTTKSRLIAGTRDQGLISSTDNGTTWNYLPEGGAIQDCLAQDDFLYALTDRGLAISGDEGITWRQYPLATRQITLGKYSNNGIILHLTTPGHKENLIASIHGATPTPVYLEDNMPAPAGTRALIIANEILYLANTNGVDLFKNEDGIWHWQGKILPRMTINQFAALHDGRVLAGGAHGLFILNGLSEITQIPLAQ